MRKDLEIADPKSCLNRALFSELLFILMGRDRAAPYAVRAWVNERIRIGKNRPGDEQIVEAIRWAEDVETEQRLRPFEMA